MLARRTGMLFFIWVRVRAPLMPEVALVELPPRKLFLSSSNTRPPRSSTVCAADRPERPPPTTITCAMLNAWRLTSRVPTQPNIETSPKEGAAAPASMLSRARKFAGETVQKIQLMDRMGLEVLMQRKRFDRSMISLPFLRPARSTQCYSELR